MKSFIEFDSTSHEVEPTWEVFEVPKSFQTMKLDSARWK